MPSIPQAVRAKLDAKGETMPGGRYPIRNATDLGNAYKDWVRTGKPADVKAWIGKRAKALGLPDPCDPESAAEDKGEGGEQAEMPAASERMAAARFISKRKLKKK